MPHFEIRLVEEKDVQVLESLILKAESRKDADYVGRCVQEQALGRRSILIGSVDGNDAGYCMLNREPQYPLYKRLRMPEIQDLNVLPDFRRLGLATAMIRHCEDLALREGAEQMGISVGLHSGFGTAQRLYVRLGYLPDGYGVTYDRQPVSPGEIRPVDDNLCLMMVKDLFS